ncbi:hypothetical protein DRH27_05125 [Candidatus Falkowbacteria bacterium]|nr:MAG: hypothetical protein DRH27_05125 [Candidatus Falkowbacteria bacterium]
MLKDENKKAILLELIARTEGRIFTAEIEERYLNRKILAGTSKEKWQRVLAGVQQQRKSDQERLDFYNEVLKEYDHITIQKNKKAD